MIDGPESPSFIDRSRPSDHVASFRSARGVRHIHSFGHTVSFSFSFFCTAKRAAESSTALIVSSPSSLSLVSAPPTYSMCAVPRSLGWGDASPSMPSTTQGRDAFQEVVQSQQSDAPMFPKKGSVPDIDVSIGPFIWSNGPLSNADRAGFQYAGD